MKRPIISLLKESLATRESLAAKADAVLALKPDDDEAKADAKMWHDLVATMRGVIATRTEDTRFHVDCKKLSEPDAPKGKLGTFKWRRLVADDNNARHIARSRARDFLRKLGDEVSEKAIDARLGEDSEWLDTEEGRVREWFKMGIVGGEEEMERIYALGCEDGGEPGGSSLCRQAMAEVKAYNTASAEKKSI